MCTPPLEPTIERDLKILPGAYNMHQYLPHLLGQRVGMVVNHTSMINHTHLVDSLKSRGIEITKIFAPEHGYLGKADAGQHIKDGKKDEAILISLYGKKKKPSGADLEDVDVLIFDIQDVGARFYTYISTLHYVMESAVENGIPIIVLDRPNPNGFYVDGSVLDTAFSSFIGMHPVPVVYGLTIGEYATMINGEGWLNHQLKADLKVIKCNNYDHTMTYDLPIKPSPNLPNLRSILLYPSLCYFEGTNLSIGRGTGKQFQVIGHPALNDQYSFSFIPKSREGAKYPKHQDKSCYGKDFTSIDIEKLKGEASINLSYLISFYQDFKKMNEPFFIANNFFNKLSGGILLKEQIMDEKNENEIRASWQEGLDKYAVIRKKYLLYDDF